MRDQDKTQEQLINELVELREQIVTEQAKRIVRLEALVARQRQKRDKERASQKLLDSIRKVQAQFIMEMETRPHSLFEKLLNDLLSLTHSAYGFIGEVLTNDQRELYLKAHAITNISWNKETNELYEKYSATGMEFYNLKTLFGEVITTGKPVISNNPSEDPRRGGIPKGHPTLHNFLGLPLFCGEKLIGIVGIANRPDGYDKEIITYLDPFLTTCANIIEANNNYKRRKQAEEALNESEEHHRNLYDTALVALWRTTIDDGKFLMANPAAAKLVGFDSVEDLINNCTASEFYPSEDRSKLIRQLKEHGKVSGYELHFTLKDGTNRDISISAKIYPEKGYIEGVAVDVTERLRLEKKLRRSEKLASVAELATIIAHEIRNPLGAITNSVGVLKNNLELTGKQKELMRIVMEEAQRINLIIKDYLKFARLKETHLKQWPITSLMQETLLLLQEDEKYRSEIQIEEQYETDLPEIWLDPDQIRQVFWNLLINAIEAMPGKGCLKVNIKKFTSGNCHGVVVRIIDTGVGIEPAVMDKNFELFFTTKPGGSGLGLPIVQQIIEDHKGFVDIESQKDVGTIVSVFLPPNISF